MGKNKVSASVNVEGIDLPEYLFLAPEKDVGTDAAHLRFSPVASIRASEPVWQSSTSPFMQPYKKNILLTKESFAEFGNESAIGLLACLQALGFNVFLKRSNSPGEGPAFEEVPILSNIEQFFTIFNEWRKSPGAQAEDYQRLCKEYPQCSRSNTVRLSAEQSKDILDMLKSNENAVYALACRKHSCFPELIKQNTSGDLLSFLFELACRTGDLGIIKEFLNPEPPLNPERPLIEWNKKYLECAVEHNQHDVVKHLLNEFGCNVSLINVAAKSSDLKMLKLIEEELEKPTVVDSFHQGDYEHEQSVELPLHHALLSGELEVVKYLLEKYPDLINRVINQRTCLHCAIQSGNIEKVKYLLSQGVQLDVNAGSAETKPKKQTNILHFAIDSGNNEEIVLLLLEKAKESCPNIIREIDRSSGKNLLHSAAEKGFLRLVEELIKEAPELLKQGMSENSQWPGRFPLSMAIIAGHVDVAEAILLHDPDLITQEPELLLDAIDSHKIEMLEFVLEKSPELLKAQLEKRPHPIFHAIEANSDEKKYDIIKFLLEEDSSLLKITNSDGHNLLQHAAVKGETAVVKKLLEDYPLLLNARMEPNLLYLAIRHSETFAFILENYPDLLDKIPKRKMHAVHRAAKEGRADTLRVILDHRPDLLDVRDANGWTPMMHAYRSNKIGALRVLKEKGAIEPSPVFLKDVTKKIMMGSENGAGAVAGARAVAGIGTGAGIGIGTGAGIGTETGAGAGTETGAGSSLNVSATASSAKCDNLIYLAELSMKSTMQTALKKELFQMVQAGEVLNKPSAKPDVRTLIIDYPDVTHSLQQAEYIPQEVTPIEQPDPWDAAKRKEIIDQATDQEVISQFSLQIPAKKLIRLPSMAIDETILQCMAKRANKDVPFTIYRGDDDFYYVEAKSDCNFIYLLRSPIPEKALATYKEIDESDPLKQAIETFLRKPIPADRDPPDYDRKKHNEYCERLYKERLGCCRHHVFALLHHVHTKLPSRRGDIRAVCIDNNHGRIEIKHNGKWIAVTDLGGAEAQIEFSNNKKYNPVLKSGGLSGLSGLLGINWPWKRREASKKQKPQPVVRKEGKGGRHSFEEQDAESDMVDVTVPLIQKQTALKKKQTTSLFEEFTSAEALLEQFKSTNAKRVLITADGKLDEISNALVQTATAQNRPVFIINSTDDIDIGLQTVICSQDGSTKVVKKGNLDLFLDRANLQLNPPPLIIVRADNFSDAEKVRFNGIQDRFSTINGRKVPSHIQIVSLEKTISEEEQEHRRAFISRHNLKMTSLTSDWPAIDTTQAPVSERADDKLVVDLQGFTDWRSQLFGLVVVEKNDSSPAQSIITWHQSAFAEAVISGSVSNIEIINIPQEATDELNAEIQQAYAMGAFYYQGCKMPFDPQKVNVKMTATESFDFTQFCYDQEQEVSVSVKTQASLSDVQGDITIINSFNFDQLLYGKKINDGTYQHTEGLIAACPENNEPCRLYISQPLSESQWYCLFKQAQIKGVTLDIHTYLDRNDIPPDIPIQRFNPPPDQSVSRVLPNVIVTNSATQTLQQYEGLQGKLVIRVEDYNSQDLFFGHPVVAEYNHTAGAYERGFDMVPSPLFELFESGEDVVLAGEFSQSLLHNLAPLFEGKYPNVSLVIEDKNMNAKEPTFKQLPMLKPEECEYHYIPPKQNEEVSKVAYYSEERLEHQASNAPESENLEHMCYDFEEKRMSALSGALKESPLVKIIGPAAVGKSELLRLYEQHYETVKTYHGLEDIESWINGTKEQRILVLDEANISAVNYTMLASLLETSSQTEPTILHHGKLLTIPKNCKVVFMMNPLKDKQGQYYGGGRSEPKLFQDYDIPEMEFEAFPDFYIYQRILKEVVYDTLTEEQRQKVSLEDFNQKATECINDYKKGKQTPRSAQREMLRFVAEKIFEDEGYPKTASTLKASTFISTNATAHVQRSIEEMLFISRKQHEEALARNAPGKPGMLLEGEPGMGKSEMVRAVLEKSGLKEVVTTDPDALETLSNPDEQCYIQLSAGLPLSEKKKFITVAYKYGHVVWIDELNSCVDSGLEKVLNAVMTGENPQTGKRDAIKSGMRIIGTTNPAFNVGRTAIGTALKSRFNFQQMTSFSEFTDEDLLIIIQHLAGKNLEALPSETELMHIIRRSPNTIRNIRDLVHFLEENYRILLGRDSDSIFTHFPPPSEEEATARESAIEFGDDSAEADKLFKEQLIIILQDTLTFDVSFISRNFEESAESDYARKVKFTAQRAQALLGKFEDKFAHTKYVFLARRLVANITPIFYRLDENDSNTSKDWATNAQQVKADVKKVIKRIERESQKSEKLQKLEQQLEEELIESQEYFVNYHQVEGKINEILAEASNIASLMPSQAVQRDMEVAASGALDTDEISPVESEKQDLKELLTDAQKAALENPRNGAQEATKWIYAKIAKNIGI